MSVDPECALLRHFLAALAYRTQKALRDGMTPARLLQGPFADAMTHAGQLAMLRRLAGAPVPPENFIVADVSPDRLGPEQPPPASPDAEWPEAPEGWQPTRSQ